MRMTYELNIPLKRGTIEIEFDDLDELETKLSNLDVKRLETIIAGRLGGGTRKKAAKRTKKATKRGAPRKKAAKRTKKA